MIVEVNGSAPMLVVANSVSVEDRVSERSVASFQAITPGTVHYVRGHVVRIYDDNYVILFAGIVESSSEQQESNDQDSYILHTVRCADWHYLADRRVVARAYTNQAAGDIVKDMINGFLGNPTLLSDDGVTVGNVQAGKTHEQAIFNYVSVARALERLAEENGFWWIIRPDKTLYFVPRTAYTAPFTLTSDDPQSEGVTVENSAPMYRNRQYLKGGRDITEQQIEIQRGDGNKRTFVMSYPLNNEPTIETNLNGAGYVAKTVGIGGVETGFQWYWNKNTNEIFQDEGQTKLTSVDLLRVTYYGQFDMVILSYDMNEVLNNQAIEGFGTGYVENVMDDVHVVGRDAGFQIANGELSTYSVRGRTLKFDTYRSGLASGQLLTVTLPEFGLSNVQFLIESIEVVDY